MNRLSTAQIAPRLLLLLLLALLSATVLAGCSSPASAVVDPQTADLATLPKNLDAQTVDALRSRPDVLVIDVREPWEYEAGHIPGVTLIPMNDISARLSELPRDKTIILTCRSGNRSAQVTDYLLAQGFTNARNMSGGILSWQSAGLPIEK